MKIFPDPPPLQGSSISLSSSVARVGGGGLHASHDSIKPPVWSRRLVTKFVRIQFIWAGSGPRLRCAQPRTVRARYARSPPAKLDSEFGSSRLDQTGWLDWIIWGSAPNPGRLRGCQGVEPPAAFLRRSRPCVWGTAADPLTTPLQITSIVMMNSVPLNPYSGN